MNIKLVDKDDHDTVMQICSCIPEARRDDIDPVRFYMQIMERIEGGVTIALAAKDDQLDMVCGAIATSCERNNEAVLWVDFMWSKDHDMTMGMLRRLEQTAVALGHTRLEVQITRGFKSFERIGGFEPLYRVYFKKVHRNVEVNHEFESRDN